ncbi:MAG: carbamoyl phosphate synthase small subunit [Lachnospiraceae bacterium]|nr:carbamoyl phosphate synthase small subunit [Lachnospiraceae bacterium]
MGRIPTGSKTARTGEEKVAYLILANGEIFEGKSIGASCTGVGELVFTTGMVGYLETLTDPSYAGQMVLQTFPVIGNYGVIPEDFEGKSAVRGYVVRELCDTPSNFRSEGILNEFLKKQGIPGICGVDTRQLTRTIREYGVLNAMICQEIPEDMSMLENFTVKDVVRDVSTKEKKVYPPEGETLYRVTLMDFGVKRSIIDKLRKRGCCVTVVPFETKASDILKDDPDGIVLSNGPGDPKDNKKSIREVKKLLGKKPVMGICLGHQITALAMGGDTGKLKYGHRGGNQPVKDMNSGRTFITSQNHGYEVLADTLKGVGYESFVNANDGTNEGMEYPGMNCFTVQFHPEACSGPHDTGFLFDRFTKMMEDFKNA